MGRVLGILLAGILAVTGHGETPWQRQVAETGKWVVDQKLHQAVVVATLDEGNVHVSAFGTLPNGRAPDKNTLFEIGSVTKVFTGIALARLAVQGKVKLTSRLEEFYPETRGREVGTVTLRELSTHTSGLPSLPANLFPLADPDNPYAGYSAAKLVEFLAEHELPAHPVPFDISRHYSNFGVGLLAFTLWSRAFSPPLTDYDALLGALLFQELGVRDIAVTLTPEQAKRTAGTHKASWRSTPSFEMGVLAGAGALKASAASLLRFAELLLAQPPGEFMEAVRLSWTPQAGSGRLSIGLGWLIYEGADGTWYLHGGQTYGAVSEFAISPEAKRAALFLSNTSTAGPCFEARVVGVPCTFPVLEKPSSDVLKKAPGTYSLAGSGDIEVIADRGHLFARTVGGPEYRLLPLGPRTFQFESVTLEFREAETGGFNEIHIPVSESQTLIYRRRP